MLVAFSEPYIDLLHNDSLDKQARVKDELINSDVILLLESDAISDSPWVQWEIETATSLGIVVKPICIRNQSLNQRSIQALIESKRANQFKSDS
ncbi:TIR domain-containing protein [Enterovibrio gelatinilyticus]|uniref:TIR domain-containing protein n=1 Tax=Enterovibrio gelatinilyticus TaxID=2899819 RepID=UPI003B6839A5